MFRWIAGLMAVAVVGFSAQQAQAQYYIPSTVPVFQFSYPAPYYYVAPRYEYRYYPRWPRYRSRYYPSYNVYVAPRTTTTVRRSSTTNRQRPSGVHPSQYIGDPHASQYMGDPHASQYIPGS